MKLFKIYRPEKTCDGNEPRCFVIRAFDEEDARHIASIQERYREPPDIRWSSPSFAICEEVALDGPAEIIDEWEIRAKSLLLESELSLLKKQRKLLAEYLEKFSNPYTVMKDEDFMTTSEWLHWSENKARAEENG